MEDVTKFLKNIFEVADVNSDGFLTKNEVKQILQRQNPQRKISRSEVTMMMKQMDVNNDGKISFEGKHIFKIDSKIIFKIDSKNIYKIDSKNIFTFFSSQNSNWRFLNKKKTLEGMKNKTNDIIACFAMTKLY